MTRRYPAAQIDVDKPLGLTLADAPGGGVIVKVGEASSTA
jgi:hypothetical protein